MTVKARVSGVSTLCWHASPSTMYTANLRGADVRIFSRSDQSTARSAGIFPRWTNDQVTL
eukprot:1189855-Prorocentrum_minimum.AAC.1